MSSAKCCPFRFGPKVLDESVMHTLGGWDCSWKLRLQSSGQPFGGRKMTYKCWEHCVLRAWEVSINYQLYIISLLNLTKHSDINNDLQIPTSKKSHQTMAIEFLQWVKMEGETKVIDFKSGKKSIIYIYISIKNGAVVQFENKSSLKVWNIKRTDLDLVHKFKVSNIMTCCTK